MPTLRESGLEYPVLAFRPDGGLDVFPGENELTRCFSRSFDDGLPVGVQLVDAGGRSWRIAAARKVEERSIFRRLFSGGYVRLHYQLDPLPPVGLPEVKARVAAHVRTYPSAFAIFDADVTAEGVCSEIEDARTHLEVMEIFGADSEDFGPFVMEPHPEAPDEARAV